MHGSYSSQGQAQGTKQFKSYNKLDMTNLKRNILHGKLEPTDLKLSVIDYDEKKIGGIYLCSYGTIWDNKDINIDSKNYVNKNIIINAYLRLIDCERHHNSSQKYVHIKNCVQITILDIYNKSLTFSKTDTGITWSKCLVFQDNQHFIGYMRLNWSKFVKIINN